MPSEITARNDLSAVSRAQRLEGLQRDALAHEAHVAVGEGEVGPARMAAAEGAHPILQRATISPVRHPVVDRHGSAERDVPDAIRDECPLAKALESTSSRRPNNWQAAVEFRITIEPFAE